MAKDAKRVVDETIGAFKALKKEIAEYKDQLASLKVGTEEWNKAAEKLRNAQKQVDAINKAAKGTFVEYNKAQANSINALKERIKLLNQERNAMDMNSKEYKEATKELKVLNDQLREAGTSAGDWKANVGNYANSIKDAFSELGTAATGLSGSFGGLNAGMLKLATNPVGAAVLALAGAIKFLAEGIKSSEDNTKRWNEVMVPVRALLVTIQQYAQEAASKFLDFAEGLKKSEGAGKAIQVVLQVLITAFNQTVTRIKNLGEGIQSLFGHTKEYIEKFKEWAKGLQDTFQPVIDFVDKVAGKIKESLEPVIDWIIDKYNWLAKSDLGKIFGLTTIDQLKKSWEDAGKTIEEGTDKVEENADKVNELVKKENALSATRRGLMLQQAKLTGEIKRLEDEISEARLNKDYDKALDTLNKKKEKEIQLARTNVALASAELNVIRLRNSLSDSNAKDKEAEVQAEVALINAKNEEYSVNARLTNQERELKQQREGEIKQKQADAFKESVAELNQELNKLTANYNATLASLQTPIKPEVFTPANVDSYYDQINANAQAEYDAYVAMQEAKMAELERFIEAEKAAGNQVLAQETELAKLREEQTNGYAAQQKKLNDTINKSNQDRLKTTKALNNAQLRSYADLFDSISGLFEQESFAYKATATAKAIIATYLAATESFANAGGAPWGFIPMAASIAAGLANVKQIWSTNAKGETSLPSANSSTPSIAEPVMEESRPFTYTRTAQTYAEEDELNRPLWISVVDIERMQEKVRIRDEESSF